MLDKQQRIKQIDKIISSLAYHQHFVKKEEKRGEKEAYSFRPKKTKTHQHNSSINPTKLLRYQYRLNIT